MKHRAVVEKGILKVYIKNMLHLCMRYDELIGFQSWVDGKGRDDDKYSIEFYLKNKNIICEYMYFDDWKQILDVLDEVLKNAPFA